MKKLCHNLMLVVIPSDLRVTDEFPSINDILKLCMNLHTMRTVCNHFLPCVVGKKCWKMQIQAGEKANDFATVSDKAFVILILKNIWDDMMSVKIKDYYQPKNARNVIMKQRTAKYATT